MISTHRIETLAKGLQLQPETLRRMMRALVDTLEAHDAVYPVDKESHKPLRPDDSI